MIRADVYTRGEIRARNYASAKSECAFDPAQLACEANKKKKRKGERHTGNDLANLSVRVCTRVFLTHKTEFHTSHDLYLENYFTRCSSFLSYGRFKKFNVKVLISPSQKNSH